MEKDVNSTDARTHQGQSGGWGSGCGGGGGEGGGGEESPLFIKLQESETFFLLVQRQK